MMIYHFTIYLSYKQMVIFPFAEEPYFLIPGISHGPRPGERPAPRAPFQTGSIRWTDVVVVIGQRLQVI